MAGENESLSWWDTAKSVATSLSDTVVDLYGDFQQFELQGDFFELQLDNARIAQEQSAVNNTANTSTVPTSGATVTTGLLDQYPLWALVLGAVLLLVLLFVLLKAVL